MSTSKRRQRRSDEGFTLVEVLVAMGIAVVVLTASLPALLSMLKSSVTVKLSTQAKNVTQERVEQMRDLRFHVDRQNGPFLDLLDIYYTNVSSTPRTTLSVGGTNLDGVFLSAGDASNGGPTGPTYKVTTGPLAGATGFTQRIYLQFLKADGTALAATSFPNYDSQTPGRDQSPTLLVGATVITTWTDGGRTKTYRAYTRITESRPALPVIQTQARSVGLDITSTAVDGSTLELQGGFAVLNGSQSDGSIVSGTLLGSQASQSGSTPVAGASGAFNLPTQTPAVSSATASAFSGGPSCSWYGSGPTRTSNVTADLTGGLPKAPANATNVAPFTSMTASITDQGSGGGCGILSFDNLVGGGQTRSSGNPIGYEMGGAPFVQMASGAGSGDALTGSAYVTSNALTASPQKSQAGASTTMARGVTLFPNNPESGGQGLVSARVVSAAVDCGSATTSTTYSTVSGSYTLQLGWWGKGTGDSTFRWHTASWTFNSATSATPTLVSGSDTWSPTTTLLQNGQLLSAFVTASLTAGLPASLKSGVTAGQTTGLNGFPDGILTLTTASTQANEAGVGYGAIKVQLGQLACLADDLR